MVVNVKQIISLCILVLMLVITISGAMADSSDENFVELVNIYFEQEDLVVEYKPSFESTRLVICEFVLDDEILATNIISTNKVVNKIKETKNFSEGKYSFFIYCESGDLASESETVMLDVLNDSEENKENNESDEGDKDRFSDLFYVLIIIIALALMIRGLRPKTNKKKNKRLKRFT